MFCSSLRSMLAMSFAAGALIGTGRLSAQCTTPDWLPAQGSPGIQAIGGLVGEVRCAASWDPDGPGPLQPRLVVGGLFDYAGRQRAASLAVWDGSDWAGLGSPDIFFGEVLALAPLADGRLLVGGNFYIDQGEVGIQHLALWNGAGWEALGDGVNETVSSIVIRANGHVIVGGSFTLAGSVVARGIARWDGTDWFAIGNGLRQGPTGNTPGAVTSMAILPNGDILVGGSFTRAGGVTTPNIARLRFTTDTTFNWNAMSSGADNTVHAVHVAPDGNAYIGGDFQSAGGVLTPSIARWNGTAFSALGDGTDGSVFAITARPNGDIIIGGVFTQAGIAQARSIARWNGTAWSAVPEVHRFYFSQQSAASVYTLATSDAGGVFVGGTLHSGVVHWDGSIASELGDGFDAALTSMAVMSNGDLVVGGPFQNTPGNPGARWIARRSGGNWTPLGTGVQFAPTSMLALPGNELIISGTEVISPNDPVQHKVLRWNGSAWSELSNGIAISSLFRRSNGDILGAGSDGGVRGVFRWTGSGWLNISGGTFEFSAFPGSGGVSVVRELPNGDLVAAGLFTSAPGGVAAYNIARWDGTAWHAMGNGLGDPASFESVGSLCVLPDGDLVAGGTFIGDIFPETEYNNIARWDGTAWHAMGSGLPADNVFHLQRTSDGRLIAGAWAGLFEWSTAFSMWLPIDDQIGGLMFCMAILPDGNIAAGGEFAYVGPAQQRAARFAEYGCDQPPCVPDFNNSGAVTVQDIFDFLAAYFNNDPAADINNSGAITVQDIFDFLAAYFAGC